MAHTIHKASIDDILGKRCIYYERQKNRTECRMCNGRDYMCPDYTPLTHNTKQYCKKSKIELIREANDGWEGDLINQI